MFQFTGQKIISCEEFQHDGEGIIDKAGAGVEVTTPALFLTFRLYSLKMVKIYAY